MQNQTTRTLFSYWNAARRGRPAPHRFDIEPQRLSSILPETMIIEYAQGTGYRFRLAGTRLCDQFCRELRSAPFTGLWVREDRAQILLSLDQVRLYGDACLGRFQVVPPAGQPAEFELLVLPLTLDDRTNERFLGTISCAYPPAWLGYEQDLQASQLELATMPSYELPMAQLAPAAPHSQAPSQRNSAVTPIVLPARRPRLRVIQGGLANAPTTRTGQDHGKP